MQLSTRYKNVMMLATASVCATVMLLAVVKNTQGHMISPLPKAITHSGYQQISGADWPGYLMDQSNSSYNTKETLLSPTNVVHLAIAGSFSIDDSAPVTTEPVNAIANAIAVTGNTLYFGSWNGYEYAVDATTYQLRWKQFLGTTTAPPEDQCYPATIGISSNSTIIDGILYTGGGDGNVYALNAANGSIIWQTLITTPPNEVLWGSPEVVHNHVYMGTASFCDNPMVHAHLTMLDQATGKVLAVHNTSSLNKSGNSIWMKPVVVPASHTVLYATGNGWDGSPENQAIVALDWDTLQPKQQSTWSPPKSELKADPDFGASCILIPDMGKGTPSIVCHNKNGVLYSANVTATGLVPAWSLKIGEGGFESWSGKSDFSPGCFDGHTLYAPTTQTTIDGTVYPGAVFAINPQTGTVQWHTPTTIGFPMVALACANGIIAEGLSNANNTGSLAIFAAQSGKLLYSHAVSEKVYGAPVIANGHIYLPTVDGHVYDFGLPNEAPAADRFTLPSLAPQWTVVGANPATGHLVSTGFSIEDRGLTDVTNVNFTTEPMPSGDLTATTTFRFTPHYAKAKVAIVAYQAPGTYLEVYVTREENDQRTFVMTDWENDKVAYSSTSTQTSTPTDIQELQIVRINDDYFGYGRGDGVNWVAIGRFHITFTPNFIGIGAAGNGHAPYDTATFISCVVDTH